MVEFSQDIWDKIKSFRTVSNIILNSKSFIIKDVVLKYIKTEIEYNTTRIDWFSIEDNIIYSKNFARFRNQSGLVRNLEHDLKRHKMKVNNNDGPILTIGDYYKCDILISNVGQQHRFIAEFKYCKPLKTI